MKPSESEAHALLFTGQYNVAVMANTLEVSLSDLQSSFRAYCKTHQPGNYALLDQATHERGECTNPQESTENSKES